MARRKNHGKRNNFSRYFLEMPKAIQEKAIEALREGAEMVVNDAKKLVPVKTGKLRDSIKAVSNKKGTKYTITAPAQNDKGIAYGQYVEFWPGRRYPFMYPAMEANRDEIKRKVIQAIKEG